MSGGRKDDPEQIVAKAFAHPLRVRILTALQGKSASPNELSQAFNESLNLVAYHVRVLEKYDCVELVDTKQRRGATEHFYRARRGKLLDERQLASLDASLRAHASGASLAHLGDTIEESVAAGTFDRPRDGRHFSQTPLCLDDEGWEKAGAVIEKALLELGKIQEESMAGDAAAGIPSTLVIMHFETPGS